MRHVGESSGSLELTASRLPARPASRVSDQQTQRPGISDSSGVVYWLISKQAVELLKVIPTATLKGLRDFALIQTFFISGCRVSALVSARVGDLEFDGVDCEGEENQ